VSPPDQDFSTSTALAEWRHFVLSEPHTVQSSELPSLPFLTSLTGNSNGRLPFSRYVVVSPKAQPAVVGTVLLEISRNLFNPETSSARLSPNERSIHVTIPPGRLHQQESPCLYQAPPELLCGDRTAPDTT